jgi:mono/diheme cytochrome c family protein
MRTADLLNLQKRRYLDSTGHGRNRFPSDLMLFADFHQRGSFYASFGSFHPQTLPQPEEEERYSDEQAYALARFIYSLQPPRYPNKPNAQTSRGQKIFNREGCAGCHTPPLYTNNKLTPAASFTVPVNHPEKAHISP